MSSLTVKVLLVSVFVAFLFLVPQLSFAATITVDDDGSADYTNIQAAIDAASSGDIINVENAIYTPDQTINVTKSVTIRGPNTVDPRPSANTTRTVGGDEEAIIDGNDSLSTIFEILADNVTIEGLEIANGLGDLVISDDSNINKSPVIRYNIIHDSSGDEGIQLKKVDDALIEFNHVFNTVGDGINIAFSHDSVIQSNEVHDINSTNAAIWMYNDGTRDFINALIQDNLVYNVTKNDGIKLGDKSGLDGSLQGGSILNNVVHDTRQDSITVKTSDVLVDGNEMFNSASQNGALFVDFNLDNVTITNNVIRDNGISLHSGSEVNDTATTYGIRIGHDDEHSTNVSVNHNIINGNEAGLFFNSQNGDNLDALRNYWGSPTGPDATDNPDGTGDSITDNVLFKPYYLDSTFASLSNDSQHILEEETEVTEEKTEIIIPETFARANITIPSTVNNAMLNVVDLVKLTDTIKSVNLVSEITVTSAVDIGTIIVKFPSDITIKSDTSWTGMINLPQVKDKPSTVPTPSANNQLLIGMVVEIGFGDTSITFDKAVRILLPGQVGKNVGYSSAGTFTEITTVCDEDKQTYANALEDGSECKRNVGPDIIIWTKHFTEYFTYTQSPISTGGGGNDTPPSFTAGFSEDEPVLQINDNSFTLEDLDGMTQNTIAVRQDQQPVSFEITLSDNGGADNIRHIDLFLNKQGDKILNDITETYVTYDNGQTTIHDPNGIIESAEITKTEDGNKAVFTCDVIFSGTMETSDILVRAWDYQRNVLNLYVNDILQVMPSEPTSGPVDTNAEQQTPDKPIQEPVQDHAGYDQIIRQWAGYDTGSATDEQLVEVILGKDANNKSQISHWVKNDVAKWYVSGDISYDEFAAVIHYLYENGMLVSKES